MRTIKAGDHMQASAKRAIDGAIQGACEQLAPATGSLAVPTEARPDPAPTPSAAPPSTPRAA